MGSKTDILKSIRDHLIPAVELPSLDAEWIIYPDPRSQFGEVLEFVGGQAVDVAERSQLDQHLEQIPAFAEAKKVCSLVEGVSKANVDLDAIDDPHELEDVDFAVLAGQFAVAENGAVWVTDDGVKHRVINVLPQHLAIVVPVDQLLNNMHEAYQRLSFTKAGFGMFISGPSKTADIEQSLVIGAHGARSLTVFLLQPDS